MKIEIDFNKCYSAMDEYCGQEYATPVQVRAQISRYAREYHRQFEDQLEKNFASSHIHHYSGGSYVGYPLNPKRDKLEYCDCDERKTLEKARVMLRDSVGRWVCSPQLKGSGGNVSVDRKDSSGAWLIIRVYCPCCSKILP